MRDTIMSTVVQSACVQGDLLKCRNYNFFEYIFLHSLMSLQNNFFLSFSFFTYLIKNNRF